MITPANALVTIYRGTTTNYALDEVDDNTTPQAEDVAMFLTEVGRTSSGSADGMARTLRRASARCATTVDVRENDRLKDQQTGTIFQVDSVYTPLNRQHAAETSMALTRVN